MRETRLITAEAHGAYGTSDNKRLPVASNGTSDNHKQQETSYCITVTLLLLVCEHRHQRRQTYSDASFLRHIDVMA